MGEELKEVMNRALSAVGSAQKNREDAQDALRELIMRRDDIDKSIKELENTLTMTFAESTLHNTAIKKLNSKKRKLLTSKNHEEIEDQVSIDVPKNRRKKKITKNKSKKNKSNKESSKKNNVGAIDISKDRECWCGRTITKGRYHHAGKHRGLEVEVKNK